VWDTDRRELEVSLSKPLAALGLDNACALPVLS
jgi:hypothetical protein